MKITRNEAVESAILRKLRAKMDDPTRGVDGPWHASDLYLCARQRIKEKVDGAPYHDRKTIMRFAFGFAMEDYIFDGDEQKREEHLGILFTVDGRADDGSVLEMKTTAEWQSKFTETTLEEKAHWIERTRAYCATRGVNTAHVVVIFIHQRDYTAFTVTFTDRELAEAAAAIPPLKANLDRWKAAYIKDGTLPGVETRRHLWECGYCPFREELQCDKLAAAIGLPMPKRGKDTDAG